MARSLRRLSIAASAVAAGFVLAPAGAATASEAPPLPCSYWVHGCDAVAYVCDASTAICYVNPAVEGAKP